MVAGLETPTAGTITLGGDDITHAQALPAAGQHRLPELRALPAPRPSSRTSPSGCAARRAQGRRHAGRGRCSSSSSSSTRQARKRPAQLSGGQQQRVALARALINQPRGAAARRAARRPRPQAAPRDADRAQAHPDRGRPHLRPRHPRPGGGHDHGRHHRGDERGRDRADGRAGGALRAPAHDVRRQLPRPVQPDRGRGASAGRPTSRPSTCRAPTVSVPTGPRAHRLERRGLGRRPAREGPPAASRARSRRAGSTPLAGGVVTDVSFVGVSTQYLVRMPWGQELHGLRAEHRPDARRFRHGRRGRPLLAPEHTFLLDATRTPTPAPRLEDE